MQKRIVKLGERYKILLPCSEVCMAMGVANRRMTVVLQRTEWGHQAQLYEGGSVFSSPILPGEAGIYYDGRDFYYYE